MRLLAGRRGRGDTLQDRLVWQAASLLLDYPDDELPGRLDTVDELLSHLNGPAAALLAQTLAALRACDPMAAAMDYVATFDMRRH
ncbi:nitrate reductase molybdenum cofactor assembly chaperone, partial [Mycobacterium kansasii]